MINTKKAADILCSIAIELNSQRLIELSKFLRQRISQPDSYVVVLGESCSGKSTIINSLIGQGILPVSSVPSTGAITEVFIDPDILNATYSVINRNATMEVLDYPTFCELSLKPDFNVQRLRATLRSSNLNLAGVRIFDTPGYGSLIEEHDEVLIEFLPNCDAVIYSVSYRIGIQESDFEFLRKLKDLTRPGIPIYLAINRCPADVSTSNRRIEEIKRSVTSLLTVDVPVFTIPSTEVKKGLFSSTFIAPLSTQVVSDLTSPERKENLQSAFITYLDDMATSLRLEITRQITNLEMSADDASFMKRELEELSVKFQKAIDDIVKPGFSRIRKNLPQCVSNCRNHMEQAVCADIEKQSVTNKEEMIAYTCSHLLPYYARQESEEIQHYLAIELEALDQEVNNYLNEAVIKFERDIELRYSSSAFAAGAGFAKNLAGKLLNSGLIQYFAKFGGRGGAGAGMANAASHALKKVGNLFNHTFSRETHNALKHGMKRLGLTSTKALSTIIAGLLEIGVLALDLATWKKFLVSKVKKGLVTWEDEVLKLILQDLDKLEATNIETIDEISKQFSDAYKVDDEPQGDIEKLKQLSDKLSEIEKEIAGYGR